MANLKSSKTHQNLKDAFAGESQANRRYLYFAKVADVEGYPEIAGNFKETADGETGTCRRLANHKLAARLATPITPSAGSVESQACW